MSETEGRDWLVAGGEAVILQPWDRAALVAKTVMIERVMKRDVVLSDGSRFPVASLQKSASGWGTSTYLVPPTDPRVDETRAKIRLRRLQFDAEAAFDAWRRDRTAKNASAVVGAFSLLVEVAR